jgi:hypothetical protein
VLCEKDVYFCRRAGAITSKYKDLGRRNTTMAKATYEIYPIYWEKFKVWTDQAALGFNPLEFLWTALL